MPPITARVGEQPYSPASVYLSLYLLFTCTICRGLRIVLSRLRLGSLRLGSLRLGSLRLGSLRLGSLRLGSLRLGSLRLGSLRLSSLRLGSGSAASGSGLRLGSASGSAASGSAASGSAASGSAASGSAASGSAASGSDRTAVIRGTSSCNSFSTRSNSDISSAVVLLPSIKPPKFSLLAFSSPWTYLHRLRYLKYHADSSASRKDRDRRARRREDHRPLARRGLRYGRCSALSGCGYRLDWHIIEAEGHDTSPF